MSDCKHVSQASETSFECYVAVRDQDQDQDQMSVRYLRTEESLQMGTVDRDFNTVGIIFSVFEVRQIKGDWMEEEQ